MLTRRASLTEPEASAVLAEYLAERAASWPAGRVPWDVPMPDTALFTPPVGAFVVGEHDGAVVGGGGVRLLDDPGSGAGAVRAEVKHLYLRERARGRGWGRVLLAALETEAAALGARTVVLDTNDTLAVAQALYRSAGYREVERYNDNPRATHWFAKELGG